MIDLKSKVVIVTGASSGIGAALAAAFSEAGARVTLAARRTDRLEEVARACPGESLVVKSDVLQETDRQAIVRQTLDQWGRIDVLVNNAGLGIYGSFMNTTQADWRRMFEINLFSVVFLTQTVLPTMQTQGGGIVVNMASIGGLIAHAENLAPYISSKHAVVGFSRALAEDLRGSGIHVFAVCPHLTATEFFRVSPGAEDMAEEVEKYRDLMDTPEEVAHGILDQLDSDRLVLFPTAKPAKAFEKVKTL
jgi:short-subunit dehydrogenase